jgi:hypothetical protein
MVDLGQKKVDLSAFFYAQNPRKNNAYNRPLNDGNPLIAKFSGSL